MTRGFDIKQRSFFAAGERPVICPKPRKPVAGYPFRWSLPQLADPFDSEPVKDLLHILLPKIAGGSPGQSDPIQPFFCGSPPTRSANPVVLDTRFGEAIPPRPVQCSTKPGSANAHFWFDRTQYSLAPAAIRIEGFDCLNCNCSCTRGIPAVA